MIEGLGSTIKYGVDRELENEANKWLEQDLIKIESNIQNKEVPSSDNPGFEGLVTQRNLEQFWKNSPSEISIDGVKYTSNTMLLPNILHLNEGQHVTPREVLEKIDLLFGSEKFINQRENLKMFFEQGLTQKEIVERTGQQQSNVSRSIKMGVQKIIKNLTSKELTKVGFLFGIKPALTSSHTYSGTNSTNRYNDRSKLDIEGRLNSNKMAPFFHFGKPLNNINKDLPTPRENQ
jgi:hypothetical protein